MRIAGLSMYFAKEILMRKSIPHISVIALLAACISGLPGQARAQPLTTAFTYQGELQTAGLPATGQHDLRFRLFDAAAGGVQIGAIICSDNVTLSGGRFTVSLDFGAAFTGQQRFLEIEARADTGLNCTDATGFAILVPRQPLTAAPNAAFALTAASATTAATATNANQLNGQAAAFYQNAANLSAGTLSDLRLSANVALLNNEQTFTGAKTFSNAANLFTGTFTGPGGGLTLLNAGNIASGTLADLRLSTNVALLNTAQTFSAAKTFGVAPAFTGAGSPFSVAATGLVTNLNADLLDGLNSSAFLQSVPNPLTLSGSSGFSHIISGTNTSTGGIGVLGSVTATFGVNYGVIGRSEGVSGRGVFGEAIASNGITFGGFFQSNSPNGRGVFGLTTAATGSTFGGLFESNSTSGFGVRGEANASTGSNYGVYGQSASSSGYGVYGVATAATGTNYGVYGRSNSPSGYGVYGTSADNAGVFGAATATTGTNYGGLFESDSTSGRGVFGNASASTGTTYGVWGRSASVNGRGVYGSAVDGYGVEGRAGGAGRGVYGYSVGGYGGFFDTGVAGGVALYVNGTASVGVITIRGGADLAEDFTVAGPVDELEPGMLVMIDADHVGGIKLANGAYNKHVAGVISGAKGLNAAMTMGKFDGQVNARPVALSGRVWTFVDASTAAVEPGDLLTTSLTPGHAMVASDSSRSHGATIGKAMSRMPQGEKGLVLVLVNLQ